MARAADDLSKRDDAEAVETRTKVFLSYSRRDLAFSERLAAAFLGVPEFEPDYDLADHDPDRVNAGIPAGAPWWIALQEMISGAEAMVFLVSPDSAASRVCDEEIAYAQKLCKRIIPVWTRPVAAADLPPKLAALNIAIDFTQAGPGFEEAFRQLVRALEVNALWLREGRTYNDNAARWQRDGKPASGLLNAGAYEKAEDWAARRPANEPEPSGVFIEWIAESRRAIRQQIIRERRRQRRNAAIIAVMFITAGAALWGGVQGFRQLQLAKSEALLVAADKAASEGLFDRALRFAALANEGNWLRPPHPEADGLIGELAFRSPLIASLYSQAGEYSVVAVSPNGGHALTTSEEEAIFVWRRLPDGAWSPAVLDPNSPSLESAVFSPDGARIVTVERLFFVRQMVQTTEGKWVQQGDTIGNENNRVRIWQKSSKGEWIDNPAFEYALSDHVLASEFSPDGRQVIIASTTGDRILTEREHGVWESSALPKLDWGTSQADFSQDGRRIIRVSRAGELSMLSIDAEEAWQSLTVPALDEKYSVGAFFPDRAGFVTGSFDGTVRLWGIDETKLVPAESMTAHKSSVISVALCSESGLFATLSSDGTALVWQLDDTANWRKTELLGHEGEIRSVAFSPDGARIVTSSEDHTAMIWTKEGDGPWRSGKIFNHPAIVSSAVFDSTGSEVLTASTDGFARVWRVGSDGTSEAAAFHDGGEHTIVSAISSDGASIALFSPSGLSEVRHGTDDSQWQSMTLSTSLTEVHSAAFSPDGRQILAERKDGSATVWSKRADGEWMSSELEESERWARSLAVLPDQSTLAVMGDRYTEVIGESSSGERQFHVLDGLNGPNSFGVVSKAGSRIITGSPIGRPQIWQKSKQDQFGVVFWEAEELPAIGVDSASFSPDGKRLLTVASAQTGPMEVRPEVQIWRQKNNRIWAGVLIDENADAVHSAAFSSDGTRLVTVSAKGAILVADVRYLSGPHDWKRNETQGRAAAICRERMSGSFHEVTELGQEEDPGSSQALPLRRVYPDRTITEADAETYPGIRHRIGQDACANILGSPNWWEALFFWHQR